MAWRAVSDSCVTLSSSRNAVSFSSALNLFVALLRILLALQNRSLHDKTQLAYLNFHGSFLSAFVPVLSFASTRMAKSVAQELRAVPLAVAEAKGAPAS